MFNVVSWITNRRRGNDSSLQENHGDILISGIISDTKRGEMKWLNGRWHRDQTGTEYRSFICDWYGLELAIEARLFPNGELYAIGIAVLNDRDGRFLAGSPFICSDCAKSALLRAICERGVQYSGMVN